MVYNIYMDIKNYIQNLKSKPEADRKRFAQTATIACMVIVGSVWLYGLTNHLSKPEIAIQTEKDIKPFTVLANSLKDTYNNISASVGDAKSVSGVINNEPTTDTENEKMIDLIPVDPYKQQ